MNMQLPETVTIVEQGPRDGFQNEKEVISTEDKVRIIDALSDTGLKQIQVTSFVHPKWVPQLSDAEEVLRRIKRVEGVEYSALVLNEKGLQRAIDSGIGIIDVGVSASESHSRKNVNMSVDEALKRVLDIIDAGKKAGLEVRAGVMCSFGCVFEGTIPVENVLRVASAFISAGVAGIGLADTTGMGDPVQVHQLFSRLLEIADGLPVSAHFHNTRGAGLANVLAAMQAGCRSFDSTIGGLGGCPFVPGATGNIATADVVNMLRQMEIGTGVDLGKLVDCARMVEEILGKKLPGQVMHAGPAKR
jgi:hydroxymethylglutaryl-CoA lyase